MGTSKSLKRHHTPANPACHMDLFAAGRRRGRAVGQPLIVYSEQQIAFLQREVEGRTQLPPSSHAFYQELSDRFYLQFHIRRSPSSLQQRLARMMPRRQARVGRPPKSSTQSAPPVMVDSAEDNEDALMLLQQVSSAFQAQDDASAAALVGVSNITEESDDEHVVFFESPRHGGKKLRRASSMSDHHSDGDEPCDADDGENIEGEPSSTAASSHEHQYAGGSRWKRRKRQSYSAEQNKFFDDEFLRITQNGSNSIHCSEYANIAARFAFKFGITASESAVQGKLYQSRVAYQNRMKMSNSKSAHTIANPPVAIGLPSDSNTAPPAQSVQPPSARAPSSAPVFTAIRQSEFPESMKLWLQQVAMPRLAAHGNNPLKRGTEWIGLVNEFNAHFQTNMGKSDLRMHYYACTSNSRIKPSAVSRLPSSSVPPADLPVPSPASVPNAPVQSAAVNSTSRSVELMLDDLLHAINNCDGVQSEPFRLKLQCTTCSARPGSSMPVQVQSGIQLTSRVPLHAQLRPIRRQLQSNSKIVQRHYMYVGDKQAVDAAESDWWKLQWQIASLPPKVSH